MKTETFKKMVDEMPISIPGTFVCSSVEPVEQSLADYERHQDAQPEYSDWHVERVADFIEHRLLSSRYGRLDRYEKLARELFDDFIGDAMADVAPIIAGESLVDPQEAGMKVQQVARGVVITIAGDYFDEFVEEARSWGWLDD